MRTLFIAIFLVAAAHASEQQPLQSIDAMTTPSRHAWNLFLNINHPARDQQIAGRGMADTSKRVGDEGLTVWETWKSAGTDVFLADGTRPPEWNAPPDKGAAIGTKVFDIPKSIILDELHKDMLNKVKKSRMRAMDIDPDGVFVGRGGGGETRMNKATFEFIRNEGLYNIDGQEQLYLDIKSGARKPLSFPVDSIEVKSMWRPFEPPDSVNPNKLPLADMEKYHVGVDAAGKRYGLVALHIITKDVPKWFWCSFRHIDGPKPSIPSVDNYGRPSSLNGTKWAHYELSGTQTDFVDEIGKRTILSDPHIEKGFELSSCISCHALSTVGAPTNSVDADRLVFFFNPDLPKGPDRPDLLSPEGAPLGIPKQSMFVDEATNQLRYIQLDFVWSLAFRANRLKKP